MQLGESDLTDEHLVRTDKGVVHAPSVRRLAEHSSSEENLGVVVETPQKPKPTILDIPPAADPLAPPPAVPQVHEDEKEEPTEKASGRRSDARGATRHNDDAWRLELKQRRETHRNTINQFREETADDEVINKSKNEQPRSQTSLSYED